MTVELLSLHSSGLLPEENFTDNSTTHTLAADLRTAASQGDGKKPEKGALKVKTIKRNYSSVQFARSMLSSMGLADCAPPLRSRRPEGDKLMDYLVRRLATR